MKERDEGFARIAEIVAVESLIKISSCTQPVIWIHNAQSLTLCMHKISGDDVSEGELNKGRSSMTKQEQGTNKGNELQKY